RAAQAPGGGSRRRARAASAPARPHLARASRPAARARLRPCRTPYRCLDLLELGFDLRAEPLAPAVVSRLDLDHAHVLRKSAEGAADDQLVVERDYSGHPLRYSALDLGRGGQGSVPAVARDRPRRPAATGRANEHDALVRKALAQVLRETDRVIRDVL